MTSAVGSPLLVNNFNNVNNVDGDFAVEALGYGIEFGFLTARASFDGTFISRGDDAWVSLAPDPSSLSMDRSGTSFFVLTDGALWTCDLDLSCGDQPVDTGELAAIVFDDEPIVGVVNDGTFTIQEFGVDEDVGSVTGVAGSRRSVGGDQFAAFTIFGPNQTLIVPAQGGADPCSLSPSQRGVAIGYERAVLLLEDGEIVTENCFGGNLEFSDNNGPYEAMDVALGGTVVFVASANSRDEVIRIQQFERENVAVREGLDELPTSGLVTDLSLASTTSQLYVIWIDDDGIHQDVFDLN